MSTSLCVWLVALVVVGWFLLQKIAEWASYVGLLAVAFGAAYYFHILPSSFY
jgi:hypothetical protein